MTLNELRLQIHTTEGVALPTAKALRNSNMRIVAERIIENALIQVFENGFVLYQSFDMATVLRGDTLKDYSYSFADGESVIHKEDFLKEDFALYFTLFGEERIAHNAKVSQEANEIGFFRDDDYTEVLEDQSQNIEKTVENKEMCKEIYSLLTPHQAKILRLADEDGLTVREIADFLGISYSRVARVIKCAEEKIRKNFS